MKLKTFAAAFAAAAGLSAAAQAETLRVSSQSPTIVPSVSGTYRYNAELTEPGDDVSPSPTPGADSQLVAGNFFTIYDFGPVLGFSAPANWIFSQPLLGLTAPGTLPVDSPLIQNVTFTYAGPTVNADPVTDLGQFVLVSPSASVARLTQYTSTNIEEVGDDNIEDFQSIPGIGSHIAAALAPAAPFAVPTPMAGVGGLGLLGLVAYLKRRRLAN